MTLTPEQFNMLATKEDLKNFVTKNAMDGKFDGMIEALDAVVKKLDNIEHSFIFNYNIDRTLKTQ